MRQFPIGGRFKTALGVIAVAAVAASAAPAFADEPPPTDVVRSRQPLYCLQDAPGNTALPRYRLTDGYGEWWDGLPGTPEGYTAFRFSAHVAHQNWDSDQNQWVVDGEWDNVWGGPTNYIPLKDKEYYTISGACLRITGYPIGVPGDQP